MGDPQQIADALASFSLFADLAPHQLTAVSHTFEEQWFTDGQRVLRQGFTGSGFFVILEGEAVVRIDGEERERLGRGEFFGEISVLLGEPPTADIVAAGPLRCLALGGPLLPTFLLEYPAVMLRMVRAMARRMRNTLLWRN